jgi:hypothetical protein
MSQPVFEPPFSMVVVVSRDRVVPHQETSPDTPLDDMHDRDFVGMLFLGRFPEFGLVEPAV